MQLWRFTHLEASLLLLVGISNRSTACRLVSSPRRSYLAVVTGLECPASFATVTISIPASSKSEQNVLLKSWGENEVTPASRARLRTIISTAWGVMCRLSSRPPFVTGYSNAPGSIPRSVSQSTTSSHAAPGRYTVRSLFPLPPRISKALALALKSRNSRKTTSARRSPAPS
jgi:hypothetical protein